MGQQGRVGAKDCFVRVAVQNTYNLEKIEDMLCTCSSSEHMTRQAVLPVARV